MNIKTRGTLWLRCLFIACSLWHVKEHKSIREKGILNYELPFDYFDFTQYKFAQGKLISVWRIEEGWVPGIRGLEQ